jgi:replicative DNA helicase
VTLRSLRGSGSLGQIADNVIAIERDQQSDKSDVSYVRVLKNRLFGDLGPAQVLRYDKITGRLKVSGDVFADESSPSSAPGY